jgi:diguanylate cyclase (GGDEF)-like protein/PAS domain S-box-containing protein
MDCVEAIDGLEAVLQWELHHPDLILLDVEMPGLDGFEVCSRIRALREGETVPILLVTGHDDLELIRRAYDAGGTDFASKPLNWMVLLQRIRYMLRAGENLRDLEDGRRKLANAQRIASLGNWEVDLRTETLAGSETFFELFGFDRQTRSVPYARLLERIHPEDRQRIQDQGRSLGNGVSGCEYRIVDLDGSERFINTQLEVVHDADGRIIGLSGTSQDVSERKRAEERIRFLAYHDTLTGLANRRLLVERLRRVLEQAPETGAVLYIDVDRFKRINDTLDHAAGDAVVEELAERLVNLVRTSDFVARPGEPRGKSIVSRVGGDEFVLMVRGLRDPQDATQIAERVQQCLARPFDVRGHSVSITSSVGIAVWPNDGNDAETMLRNADVAMRHAKRGGGDGYRFYDASMNEHALHRLALESELRRALDGEELVLYTQPKIDLRSGALTGAEALIRWVHPTRGLVSPADFIPVAEQGRLIEEIGEWVVREACRIHVAWEAEEIGSVRVGVNLSPRQLRGEEFADRALGIVEACGATTDSIEFEVTETALMQDEELARRTLTRLRDHGFQIALDDFGTGYSSLSYLRRFPVDAVKIDRSFVCNLPDERDDAAIAQAIIFMGRVLGLRVIAEGVETEAQREFLTQHGCDEMQGYLISPAIPPDQLPSLARSRSA